MKLSDGVVRDLQDLFGEIGFEGGVEDCLDELSTLVARLLSAKGCAIILLTEEEASGTQAGHRSGFGILPGTPTTRLSKALSFAAFPAAPDCSADRGAETPVDSMFATIVLKGKTVGVMHAVFPQQQGSFSKQDLDLLTILTPIIAKSIQVIQLQQLLKSRFTQMALSRSGESVVRDMLSGVAQNPNQIARILARSFYREMLRAGFNFKQILFAATEVISELSAGVRQNGARRKQKDIEQVAPAEPGWNGFSDETAAQVVHKEKSTVNRISA